MDFELTQREQARLDAAQGVLATAAKEAGLVITADMVAQLPSVKIATLSADALDVEAAMRELKQVPAIAAQLRNRAIAEELANADSATHEELARMNRTQRLSAAHRLEQAKPAPAPAPKITPAQEAERIRLLATLPPQARMNKAREWGLL